MTLNDPPPSISNRILASIPGKVFVLGEYAVLDGGRALLASCGPRFGLEALPSAGAKPRFDPELPVGAPAERLLHSLKADQGLAAAIQMRFSDAHEGRGGFGGSTAQFALTYRAFCEVLHYKVDALAAWQLYRDLCSDQNPPPSGADLVAQWNGGTGVFDPKKATWEDLTERIQGLRWLVFSAAAQKGRKVPTHHHLEELAKRGFLQREGAVLDQLKACTEQGVEALRSQDLAGFGAALRTYARTLQGAGLELDATREDREALGQIPGVLAVKGAGAMQADAILVLLSQTYTEHTRAQVLETASQRGLIWISDALGIEKGIQCVSL